MLEPTELFPEVPNLYEFPSVHADMVFDQERVGRYSEAIANVVRPGDVVADIGTGTGLLAFLSLKAGARRVHAIERSPAIRWAKMLAETHGYADRICFYNEDSRSVELPEKVDVVVSELIGHIAFEEGMVESLFDAKRRFLACEGKMIPKRVELRVTPVAEREVYRDYIDRWGEVAGIDYSPLREEAIKACYVTTLSDRELLSEPQTFFEVSFDGDKAPKLQGERVFVISRSGELNGIALWFNAELTPGVGISSGPWTSTHWGQCFAPVSEPIRVKRGDRVSVRLIMKLRDEPKDVFSLSLDLSLEG
ncbi:MAG: 50S ribosomal protein L11 methyltransferase [Actinobacteria bacterium]|nr:50S ribosomal protein L11 methyltransferase [Actinomycetota bacterium]